RHIPRRGVGTPAEIRQRHRLDRIPADIGPRRVERLDHLVGGLIRKACMREERPSAETGRQWYVLREASDTLAGDRPEGPTQVVDAFGHGRVEGEKSHAVPQGQWAPPLDALVEDGVERPFPDSSK